MLNATVDDSPIHLPATAADARPPVVSRGASDLPGPRTRWLAAGLLALLLAVLYLKIGVRIVLDWYRFPDQSHGLLIPVFIAFVLWEERSRLAQLQRKPSWAGIWELCIGLLVLLIGVLGADLFLSRFSFLLVAAGLIWGLLGKHYLKGLRFCFLMAFLAIPLPALILNQITFPLQLFASQLASAMLAGSGVPVLREGNVIQLASLQLEVAEACSGIRSLMSLLTVAVIFGYFAEKTVARRLVLVIASIPIAIAANVVRIYGTGMCVQYWDPEKATGFFHEFSGWLMFIVSLVCLYVLHILIRLYARWNRGTA